MIHLIYFSPVTWGSFHQRPHHFVNWFRKKFDARVTWIEPYPTRTPRFSDIARVMSRRSDKVHSESTSDIEILKVRALPVEPLPIVRMINSSSFEMLQRQIMNETTHSQVLLGVGKPSLLALQFLKSFKSCDSFYDAMDDFPSFFHGISRERARKTEYEIVKIVKSLIVSSKAIASKFSDFSEKTILVRNACTSEKFSHPQLASSNNEQEKVIGYVGTVASWFDWEFVTKIANLDLNVTVKIIGPIHSTVPPLPKNIKLMGICALQDAIKHMETFDVGIIPFHINDLTRHVDPIKYYEYRCAGLPVISSEFGEMKWHTKDPGVFIMSPNEISRENVLKALSFESTTQEIFNFRNTNSWDFRFEQLVRRFRSS